MWSPRTSPKWVKIVVSVVVFAAAVALQTLIDRLQLIGDAGLLLQALLETALGMASIGFILWMWRLIPRPSDS